MLCAVPVFDGRATASNQGFRFNERDFNALLTWPLYEGGGTEVLFGSIISVIYMLSTYCGSSGFAMSSNLISVILLALP